MELRKFVTILDRLILYSVALLTPVIYSGWAFLLKHTFTQLFITLIFGVWLLKVIIEGGMDRPRHQLLWPLSALLLVSALSLLKAVNVEAGIREIYRLALFIILYFVAVEALQEKDRWRIIAGSMVLGGVLTCLVGFYQFLNPHSSYFWIGGEFIGAIGNRTYLGAYLLTVIPLSIALLFLSDSWLQRVAWGIALVFLNVAIVLTRSRAAWLGLAIGLGLMAVLVHKQKVLNALSYKRWVAKGVVAVLAILISSWGLGTLLFTRGEPSQIGLFRDSVDFGSLQSRVSYWWDSLTMIRDNLFLGIGTGNFTSVFFRYADLPQGPFTENVILEHPHNEYISLAAELGVLGLLAFSWLLFRIGWIGWEALKRAKEREEAFKLSSLLGCLVSVAINAVFFYPFHEPSTAVNLFLILSVLDVTAQGASKETENVIASQVLSMSLIRRGAIWLSIFAFLAALFYHLSFRPLMGSYYFGHSANPFFQAKFEESIANAERSLSWDPRSFLPRFLLAQNYFSMGRYSEAVAESEKLLRFHPYLLFSFDMIAMSYIAKGETPKALETYERALKVNPRLTTALVNLGVLHLKQKQYNKAKVLLERAISVAPQRPEVYMNLALLHRELGQTEEALSFYYEAVRRNPSLPHAWYAIAGLEAEQGRTSEALRALGRAFSLDPTLREQAKTDAAFDRVKDHERFKRIVGQ